MLKFYLFEYLSFGGKIVILSGDFRQILPVESKPMDSMNTCLKKSYLWTNKTIQPKSLTINERVRQFGGHDSYATFLMYVGLGLLKTKKKRLMGTFKEYEDTFTRIPSKIGDVQIVQDFEDLDSFIGDLFPNMAESNGIPQAVVLTPKNKNMHEINEKCLNLYKPDEEPIVFKSSDRPYIPEQEGFIPEDLLNAYNPGGLPPHELKVKPGCYLMLLRNLCLENGLANGTRLKMKSIHHGGRMIRAEVLTGPRAAKDQNGNYIYNEKEREFPFWQMPISNENDRVYKMVRKQYPMRLTYCMSINKAQGQTLKRVGLYLPNPVFSHGQLYVALSRVSRPENVTVFIDGSLDTHGKYRNKMYTKNVVYQQLLREEIRKFENSDKHMGEFPDFDGVEESEDEGNFDYIPGSGRQGWEMEPEFEERDFEEPEYGEPEFEEPDFEERDYEEPDYEEPDFEEPVFEQPDFEEPEHEFNFEEPDFEEPDLEEVHHELDYEEPDFGEPDHGIDYETFDFGESGHEPDQSEPDFEEPDIDNLTLPDDYRGFEIDLETLPEPDFGDITLSNRHNDNPTDFPPSSLELQRFHEDNCG